MKFIGLTLINHTPNPITGVKTTVTERFDEVIDNAVLFEELGFDGFGVGERHHTPFISTAPPVVLSHIAALTSKIRLFTGVTLLSVLDPVRVAEDYATLDHLSGGRLELIIGKGNGPEQAELFGITRDQQWDTITENYRLLRRLWLEQKVTWSPSAHGIRQVPLVDAAVWPRPLQQPAPRIWHGSATSKASVDLAAEHGDPVFSANVTNPVEPYAELIRHYRERWAHYGREPKDVVVGAGTAGHYTARTSQEAKAVYEPIFLAQRKFFAQAGLEPVFADYDDYVARSSALIGSPEQVLDKVHRYHEELGHTVLHVHSDHGGLTPAQHRDSLELFQAEVAPELRHTIADPPWPGPAANIQRRKAFR
jgi:alkanesulfonate monooxygenase SsuD/methylene tetrahydromethanopterin reductase-like flavin-dependent oxidoreductase (luciferase family)